jgi:TusA-related sulfurtransferase
MDTRDGEIMTRKNLDLTGKVCPYCLLAVQKESKRMNPLDELVITCDHPPAATESIPWFARESGFEIESRKTGPGLWEILLRKR